MKKIVGLTMCAVMCVAPLSAREEIDQLAKQTDELYRVGAAEEDGSFTALAMSILGWGIALAVGIGALTMIAPSGN
jgi:hypothetical protein